MRMDAGQFMRLDQRMNQIPRLIQSAEILQLPLLALQERIDKELAVNPVLEVKQDDDPRSDLTPIAGIDKDILIRDEKSARQNEQRLLDYEYDRSLSHYNRGQNSGDHDAKYEAMQNTAAEPESLQEQLHKQWDLQDEIDPASRAVGHVLIEAINADGYLGRPLADLASQVPPEYAGINLEQVLELVQERLEPTGIGARDLPECLALQLQESNDTEPALRRIALSLLTKYRTDFEMNRLPQIIKRSGYTIEQITTARKILAKLNPRPGRTLVDTKVPTITPDAVIEWDSDTQCYQIRLADECMPRLSINETYLMVARNRGMDDKVRKFLGKNISNARWLIQSLEERRSTMMRVLRVVVEAQQEFLEKGPNYLRPLPMTLVADQLGIHVSTVSRAVAEKYVQTDRGILPLRMFFTGGTQNADGDEMSWEAVRGKMSDIIAHEDKAQPLSDDDLVAQLKAQGIVLARRTVAKYRMMANIPPARRRRVFA